MTEHVCFNICLFMRESDGISQQQIAQHLYHAVHIKIAIEKSSDRTQNSELRTQKFIQHNT